MAAMDPEMKAFLDEIVSSYAPVMERKVGEVSFDMIVRDQSGRHGENGLCDFVADAFRAVGGTQAALLNAGSVRNNLEAGTITYNDVLNFLPYSNDVVTASVTGQMLLDALEFGVSKLPAVSAGFPQVSGITFRVNPELESSVVVDDKNQFVSVAGEYRVFDVMVGQEPLDPKAEYALTGTSFLLNGGDAQFPFARRFRFARKLIGNRRVGACRRKRRLRDRFHLARFRFEGERQRNDLAAFFAQRLLENGMAGLPEVEFAVLRNNGCTGYHIEGRLGLRHNEIKLSDVDRGLFYLRDIRTQELGKCRKYRRNLPRLGEMELGYFIGQLHYLGRLDEGGLAGRGLVVDEALNLPLVGRKDRNVIWTLS